MNTLIKTIEDLSLNAWPSHQIELYDGWILRFSYFYTHRTNSVEQIGPSTIPVEEKVQYCEEIYRRWGTPAIFKISPLVNPGFDAMLADRGYVVQHTTHVMTMDLANFAKKDPAVAVTVSSFIPPKWIDSLFALKSTTNVMHRMVVPSMYRAIPKETICTSIQDETGRSLPPALASATAITSVSMPSMCILRTATATTLPRSAAQSSPRESGSVQRKRIFRLLRETRLRSHCMNRSVFPISIPTGSARRTWSDFRLISHKKA